MALNRTTSDGHPVRFVQGNEAVVLGALHSGCRFFGGYPITPSTEIAEGMARELPKVGGVFIQMEDEIASIASIIGASAAGAKSMTATSGPGFSLMQENLGFAYITQLPIVIVNVQRGGPSTGLPTKLAQSDTMQARWGTHGDYTAVVLAASSVQESYEATIRAFELAEKLSTPVIVLLDELIGHMREKLILRMKKDIKEIRRPFPKVPPEWYFPYDIPNDYTAHPAPFGEGFRYSITGLVHDRTGFPTSVPSEVIERLDALREKIITHRKEIWNWKEYEVTDAKYLIVAYGSAARAARGAVAILRKKRIKAGFLELKSIWPFPDGPLMSAAKQAKYVFVAENNMGQLIHAVRENIRHTINVIPINRYDGHPLEPEQIVYFIKEEVYGHSTV
ncbi:2-oxoacid:acceptor oxidoreductase subunit alpha [bacterium]|nr:2-oxoacid:acceptor oxidoreductase subunit alpha [bacterium]